ncbi:DUF4258 domain-containing protein [Pseudomonas sp. App30]|uniref:DUF4258 domain-containing protein n=1 Tax=Pseudomonas sp. App30 TaxID=3068990 RepID=UPI003A7FDACB
MIRSLPYPLPKQTALSLIRQIAVNSGRVLYTAHARQRMTEREITLPDVMECLAKGQITEGPAYMPKGDWRFTLSWFRAGSPLQVVGAIDIDEDGTYLVVVTAIQKQR